MRAHKQPVTSVVIGSFNRARYLKASLDTVRAELAEVPHEIIVVDGGSTDGSLKWLTRQKDVITVVQHNRGKWRGVPIERKSWGYFMNLGFRAATGKYVCMLSDDCLVVPGAILYGLDIIERASNANDSKIAAVAFYWRNWPEQESYWVGLTFGNRLFVNHGLYLRKALEEVGFFDADSYHFYHADGDLCLRLHEAKYLCIDSPRSFIEHNLQSNAAARCSNSVRQAADWEAYRERWGHLGEPEKPWRTAAFTDPAHTAEKYWGRGLESCWGKVKKLIFAQFFGSAVRRTRRLVVKKRQGPADDMHR